MEPPQQVTEYNAKMTDFHAGVSETDSPEELSRGAPSEDSVGVTVDPSQQSPTGSLPSLPMPKEHSVRISRDELSGQFFAQALINGQPVQMLVDTGAWTVVLCADDAKHIGVGLDKLSYSLPATTPSGLTHVAPIKLSSLLIQLIGLSDVAAVVSQFHDK